LNSMPGWQRGSLQILRECAMSVSCTATVHALPSTAPTSSVSAGATKPAETWLDGLAEGGRLILPLTAAEFPAGDVRQGAVLRIERRGADFLAQRVSAVAIFPCEGMRDAQSEAALAAAFEKGRVREVARLYRRDDVPEEDCWLRGVGWSLAFR
jgi:protein-L-isoaspartate(D-aspartate) O-methyltransferase